MHGESATRLSVSYVRLVVTAVALLLLFVALLLVIQYEDRKADALAGLRARVAERAVHVDAALRSTADQVRTLRRWAEQYLARDVRAMPSPLLERLRDGAGGQFFSLDLVEPDPLRAQIGNLVGAGSIGGRDGSFLREVNMALWLFGHQRAAAETLPHIARTAYISARRFEGVFPWQHSEALKKRFGVEAVARVIDAGIHFEAFERARPEHNPGRAGFWSGPAPRWGDDGLTVTRAAPVYEREAFRGMVAADLSLPYLNGLLHHLDVPNGRMLVVDEGGRVVADSDGLAAAGTHARRLDQLLPRRLAGLALKDLPAGFRNLEGHWIAATGLGAAPWVLLFLMPERDLRALLFPGFLPEFAMFGGLLAFLFGVHVFLRRHFIRPALALVEFMHAEAEGRRALIPDVPPAWYPWFERIDQTLNTNRVLIDRVIEDAEHLHRLVDQRTRALSGANRDLLAEVAERRRVEAALRQSEARLALAIEASGVGVFEHAIPPGADSHFSDRWAGLLGVMSDQVPGGASFFDWWCERLHPEDRPHALGAYDDFVDGRTESCQAVFRARHADGRWVRIRGYGRAMTRDPAGRATRMVGVWVDVSG